MDVAFWTALFTFASSTVAALFAYLSKLQSTRTEQQSKANASQLAVVSREINGHTESRLREARQQVAPQILLVDDNKNDLELMRHVLEKYSSDCFEAQTLLEARDLIRARVGSGRGLPFDLAIVDLNLNASGSDALEVIEMMNHIAPWVPVVIITGAFDVDLVTRAAKSHPTTLLLKPLDERATEELFRQYRVPFHRIK